MNRICRILATVTLIACSSGCVSSDVISTGPDTYMVTASGAGFSTAGVREKVYAKANEYCASRGLVMVPVSFKAHEGELGRRPPNADLIFRALKPGDPAIGRPNIRDADQNIHVSNDLQVVTRDESIKQTDLYTEIMKLDDLRKKGLITDTEFEQQKQRLLSQAK